MTEATAFLSVAEGARRLAEGRLSAREWTDATLARIAEVDPLIHSTITVAAETARDAADAADAERRRGRVRGPLHGVPLGLKDCIETASLRTTAHSAWLTDHVPTEDAALVQRLKAAGAVIVAKHALYEFSYGGPSFDLPWPPARNPWNRERIPGGSSSGTGAAVAAGLCAAGVGTDAGGSIRQPAAFCGVTGLKPSPGLVPLAGVLPMSFTLGEAGPMARSAADCALVLDVLAGTTTAAGLERDLSGLRIGVLDAFQAEVEPAVQGALGQALAALETAGLRVTSVQGPDLRDLDACGRVLLLAEAFANHEPQLRGDPGRYGRIARHRFLLGAYLSAADYVHATRQRARLVGSIVGLFEEVDLLVAPGEAAGAPTFEAASASFGFTGTPSLRMPFTVAGLPALAVPCGFDAEGLPLSMQLVARPGGDGLVLAAGAVFQSLSEWHRARPPL